MNKKYIFGGILILLIIGFFFISQHITSAKDISNNYFVEINEFSTDKEVYSSREKMLVNLEIKSSRDIENIEVILEGIKPYNTAYIQDSAITDLKKGLNQINFEETTPSCTSGCGGVYPGDYDINIKVIKNGYLITNSSITITLISG